MAEWIPTWKQLPDNARCVAILLVLKDGSFVPDIGRYYGEEGWNAQWWSENPHVAGWCDLPPVSPLTNTMDPTP